MQTSAILELNLQSLVRNCCAKNVWKNSPLANMQSIQSCQVVHEWGRDVLWSKKETIPRSCPFGIRKVTNVPPKFGSLFSNHSRVVPSLMQGFLPAFSDLPPNVFFRCAASCVAPSGPTAKNTCRSGCIWTAWLPCVCGSAWSARHCGRTATRSLPTNTCTASHLCVSAGVPLGGSSWCTPSGTRWTDSGESSSCSPVNLPHQSHKLHHLPRPLSSLGAPGPPLTVQRSGRPSWPLISMLKCRPLKLSKSG